MSLTITPGGASDDAYISLAAYKAYCDARGYSYPADDDTIERGIRRATQWVDNTYGQRFIGCAATVTQALEWPRSYALYRGAYLDDETIPTQIEQATAEAAKREIATPGTLSPDRKRGGKIKRVKAGSAEVEFADGATADTLYTIVDGLLRDLAGSAGSSLAGASVRGN